MAIEFVVLLLSLNARIYTILSDFFSCSLLVVSITFGRSDNGREKYRMQSTQNVRSEFMCCALCCADIKSNKGDLVLGHIVLGVDRRWHLPNRIAEDTRCIVNCSNEMSEREREEIDNGQRSRCAYAWRHLADVPSFLRQQRDTYVEWERSALLDRPGRVPKHKRNIDAIDSARFLSMGVRCPMPNVCPATYSGAAWNIHIFCFVLFQWRRRRISMPMPSVAMAIVIHNSSVITVIMEIMTKKWRQRGKGCVYVPIRCVHNSIDRDSNRGNDEILDK